jgi:hypothetical protein
MPFTIIYNYYPNTTFARRLSKWVACECGYQITDIDSDEQAIYTTWLRNAFLRDLESVEEEGDSKSSLES